MEELLGVTSHQGTISNCYDALGVKKNLTYVNGVDSTKVEYLDGVIYKDGLPKQVLTETGYLSLEDNVYRFYIKDYLGSIRLVKNSIGTIEEINNYLAEKLRVNCKYASEAPDRNQVEKLKTPLYIIERRFFWWERRDSNPRPSACKADALNQLSYAPDSKTDSVRTLFFCGADGTRTRDPRRDRPVF